MGLDIMVTLFAQSSSDKYTIGTTPCCTLSNKSAQPLVYLYLLDLCEFLLFLPSYFTNSLGEISSKSATLKMVVRLGCLRLQT